MRTTLKLISLFLAGMLFAACEQDGPAERAGEAIDDAAGELSDFGDDVGDAIEDAGDDMADAVEDACEEVKDGVDAQNKNC